MVGDGGIMGNAGGAGGQGGQGGTGDPGGGAAGGGGGGGAGSGGNTPSWVGNLPSDYGGPQILSQIPDSNETATVPVTLVKNYVENQKAIGGMMAVPQDGDPPEKFEKFYQNIGRPEKPDGYELKSPDGAPEGFYRQEELKEYQEKAHSLGIPKKAAEELFAWRASKDLEVYNEFTGGAQKTHEENIAALKKEWGMEFDNNATLANKAAAWAGGSELATLLQQAGLVGHPIIAKAFQKIGQILGEDTLKGVDVGAGGSGAPRYTAEQLKEMTADPQYQKSQEFRDKVQAGWEALYAGTAPATANPSRPRTR